jgi:outer membrane protein assembly factor BamB
MSETRFYLSLSLCIFLLNCSGNKPDGWPVKFIGEVYHCLFIPENKIIVTANTGIFCYDLDSGNQEWKINEITTLYKPVLMKDALITGAFCESGLYSISVKDGKIEKLSDLEEWIHAVQVQDENNILAIAQDVGAREYTLIRYNIGSGETREIIPLDAVSKSNLEYFDGNIILSTAFEKIEKLYIIDGTSNTVKWKDGFGDDIYTLLDNSDFIRVRNSVYYIKREGTEYYLMQVSIDTGSIIERIAIPFQIASNYIQSDGENILICGMLYYYTFNTTDRQFSKVVGNRGGLGYESFINNDNIAFASDGSIYCYSIRDKVQKRIYDLEGKQIFVMFGNAETLVLVVADNVIESLADNLPFYLSVIKQ